MLILRSIFWNKTVEDGFHINPYVWIRIFIDAQSAARMLAEDVDDADSWQPWQLTYYFARHQMKAPWFGSQRNLSLLYHFFQAFTTSPMYIECMPAGKRAYMFCGTSLLKYFGSNGAAYIIRHSITMAASV